MSLKDKKKIPKINTSCVYMVDLCCRHRYSCGISDCAWP